MRLTVGPLEPAVYWRRRALVLGGVLVAVLLLTYTCSGESGAKDGKKAAQNTKSSAQAASPTPAASVLTPIVGGGPGSVGPSTNPPADNPPPAANPPAAGNGGGGPCADTEITVVPAPEAPTARQGVPTRLTIKIKNVSGRTCVRSVGADMQELYLQQNGAKAWSSDSCATRSGNDVVTFPPNHEVSYSLTWDGKSTAQGCENRPWLAKGSYQLYGRLGTKISEPVPFAVTG